MDKRICDVCRTENELHYEYCKNCGNEFLNDFSQSVNNQNITAYTLISPYDSAPKSEGFQYEVKEKTYSCQNYGVSEIEGVKTEDLAAYIGPNNERIINKFSKMEKRGSNVSWCWPVAVLGLLLGLFGASFWFIYRKMYKFGILLLAVSLLLECAIVTVGGSGTSHLDNFICEIIELEDDSQNTQPQEIPEIEANYNSIQTEIALFCGDIIMLATIVFGGLFSINIYKKYAVGKIRRYNIINASERYRQIGIMTAGGTSMGITILAIFVSFGISEVLYAVINYLFQVML